MAIHKTAIVDKSAEISSEAEIGPGVMIERNVAIGPGVKIMANAFIGRGTTVGDGTVIHMGAVIGHEPQDFSYKGAETFTKIGKNNIIREYVTIHRGTAEGSSTIIGDSNFLMGLCHLGHNCKIGNKNIIANSALLAGHTEVGDCVFISGNVVFHQFCRIGSYAMIGGFTGVNKDVPPYMLVRGPSAVRSINLIGLRRAGFKSDIIREIKESFRILFRSGLQEKEALEKIKTAYHSDEIKHLISFIENSKRGICKARYAKEEYFE
ncbi:MAG: acyl-ACP--UDP-N-acetylglucosamine O-acyltransferase [Candidatus Omnitrophica bacterium]|nr:acyl-ACP--UDP-N-acetylglucosamine O-acyltransferase [Candidatus Omnitrophota bacterium]